MAIKKYLIFIALLISFCIQQPVALAQTVTRLTFYTGTDLYPVWNPANSTIAYIRSKTVGGSVFDVYKVLSSGTGGEQAFLTGLSSGNGVAVGLSWIGSSGLLGVEETVSGFEELAFNTNFSGFNRTQTNGADSANSILLSVDGGGGSSLLRFSRDGNVALTRFSSSGSSGNISIRFGSRSAMVGQAASTFGQAILTVNNTTDGLFYNGAALNPDGSKFALSYPLTTSLSNHDIVIGNTVASATTVNLTNSAASGVSNISPDFSPDGTKIVFARKASVDSTSYDLYVMNVDGSNLTQVTSTPNFSETYPSWSPDGQSIVFMGIHSVGHETEAPALQNGEAANYNIYLLTLPATPTPTPTVAPTPTPGIVTPKTKLTDPPAVSIDSKNVTFKFVAFAKALKSLTSKSLLARIRTELRKAPTNPKFTFQYELMVNRTVAKKRDVINKTSKKNSITLKNLKAGNYSARYRVEIMKKEGSKVSLAGRTKFSPPAKFSIN